MCMYFSCVNNDVNTDIFIFILAQKNAQFHTLKKIFAFALSKLRRLKFYVLIMSNLIIFKTLSKTHFSDVMCVYFSYVSNDVITDIINLFILLRKIAHL